MKKNLCIVALVVVLLSLSACAEKGPLLVEGITYTYQTPEGMATGAAKVVVGVSPIRDERGKTSSILGKRTIRDSIENDLVVQGTVADLVTNGFKNALQARGVTVKDLPAWDLNAETIKAEGANIIIGGQIKAFWVDAVAQPLNVNVNAEVQLRVSAADAAEKKVFRTLVLNSKVERQDISFSLGSVAAALSEALSRAVDQLMSDDEFKKRIK